MSKIWWIVVLALLARGGWILFCPNEPISDQQIYHTSAVRMAEGLGYVDDSGNPQGYWPVGYPATLAAFYAVFGARLDVAFCANLLFGLACVLGVWAVSRELFGPTTGRAAALVVALHPTLVTYTTVIASENLFLPGCAWAAWLFVRAARSPGPALWWLASGVLLGLLAYVRSTALLLPIVYLAACWAARTGWPRTLSGLAIAGGLAVLVLIPFGLRNQDKLGKFSILSTNGGANLWMGNHEGSSGGYTPIPEEARQMGLAERDSELRGRAIRFIIDNPLRYLSLCLKRVALTMKSDTIAATWNEVGIRRRLGDGAQVYFKGISTAAHFLLWGIAVIGLVSLRRHLTRDVAVPIAGLMVTAAPALLIVGGNRYNLPMVPFLVPLVAYLVVTAADNRRTRGAVS